MSGLLNEDLGLKRDRRGFREQGLKQSNQRILILLTGLLVFTVADLAHAQRSRRVIRQDLSVQPSAEATTRIDEPAADTKKESVDSGVALPIGWQPKPVYAVTGTTAVTAGTTATNTDNQQMMQMMSALAGALGGGGQKAGTGTTGATNNNTATNTGTTNGTNTSGSGSGSGTGNDTNPGTSRNPATTSTRDDSPGSSAPLPQDTSVNGRVCSDTHKTWQPFTAQPFRITSCFGPRRSKGGRHHNGIDAVIEGGAIHSVAPGRIVSAKRNGGYGCEIVIEHDSCPAAIGGTKCYSQYAHMEYKDKKNKVCAGEELHGTKVNACTRIGTMGNTGASDGAHLHFEVRTAREAGTARDPVTNFREWQAHSNYQYGQSTCGTVGDGKAPEKQVPGGQSNDTRR